MTSLHTVSQRVDEYASLTRKLFGTLEALADDKRAASGGEGPKAIIERIIALDAILQKEVDQIEEHQRWQQQILDTEMAIDGCDRAAERLVRTLHQAKMTLEDMLGAKKRLTIRKWKTMVLVDFREYFTDAAGEERPTKKGLSLTKEQWEILKSSIPTIDQAIDELK
ncbi:transcriptional Coactivator p15-domain-containing protein [Syncephalis pseudoplumigaleata]|uniref:Transcriptional Coactivator p15-domain-containing protein n=1 Tax=Syncephalis pseudoplumigaleata TaxID=1712513 RepID=A0A4P9YTQ6_9FUNG|nr:transcriptional Coactivator p15-domain-containing protein [Syncephalis pseudoplumigaleata]|eukprot:RKP23118.1 transcriptional Coactivator p15-domain-containing protein [Syncephalis pseudoplumigaleata]